MQHGALERQKIDIISIEYFYPWSFEFSQLSLMRRGWVDDYRKNLTYTGPTLEALQKDLAELGYDL